MIAFGNTDQFFGAGRVPAFLTNQPLQQPDRRMTAAESPDAVIQNRLKFPGRGFFGVAKVFESHDPEIFKHFGFHDTPSRLEFVESFLCAAGFPEPSDRATTPLSGGRSPKNKSAHFCCDTGVQKGKDSRLPHPKPEAIFWRLFHPYGIVLPGAWRILC
jgi:hypothetical protein